MMRHTHKYHKNISIVMLTIVFLFANSVNVSAGVNANVVAKLDYYQAKVDEGLEPFDKLLPFYDTIIQIYAEKQEAHNQIRFMIKKAEFANSNGNGIKSFYIYREILTELSNCDSIQIKAERKKCLYAISRNALDLGMFDESASYAFELLKYVGKTDLNYVARGYSILSFIFVNLNKMEEAEEYNIKATNIIKTVDTLRPSTSYSVYSNCAGIFFTKQEPDSAIKYLTIARSYIKDIKDPKQYNNIYHNFAILYEAIGEYAVAKSYYIKTLELVNYDDRLHLTALTYNNLARLYGTMGEVDKSLEYYLKSLKVATKIGATKIRGDALIAISALYYDKNEFKKSRDFLEEGRMAKDSVFNTQNVDRISILTNDFEMQNDKIEKELMKKTIALSGLRRNVLIGILVLVLIAVAIISTKLISQRKANKALNKMVSTLKQKNQQYEKGSKYKFESIIDVKNKELTATTLSLVTANEILEDIKEQVEESKLQKGDTKRQQTLENIEQLVKSYNPEHGKEEFRLYFEQVQQSFFIKLNERHPDLSYDEQRICALLILNLSAKEIANITNKSIRTVETNIYRLRKSMDIPAKVKTFAYLRQFVE